MLCASHFVDQLAMALGRKIPKERAVHYLQTLSDLTESQIEHGFTTARNKFVPGYGIDFPSPGQIREWCLEWKPDLDARRILPAETKPEGWEPDAAQQLIEEMRAKLRDGAFQMTSSREIAENLAKTRNAETAIPEDPAAKAPWARDMAEKQGWK